MLEFLLGNKNAAMIAVFAHHREEQAALDAALRAPSLYDEFLRFLHRRGYPIPGELVERDWTKPHTLNQELVRVFTEVYNHPDSQWDVYETCEELIDVEDSFQTWRFRHLKTVERIIGFKRGTGGSSGVSFLRRALDLTFFPELYAVRTEIGR
jgi:tryptophan 2,3-dioxygenase